MWNEHFLYNKIVEKYWKNKIWKYIRKFYNVCFIFKMGSGNQWWRESCYQHVLFTHNFKFRKYTPSIEAKLIIPINNRI